MDKYWRKKLVFVKRHIHTIDLPQVLNERTIVRLRLLGQILGIILLTAIVTFIFIGNSAPLNIAVRYSLGQKQKEISPLGPKDRVSKITKNGDDVFKQKDDLIYFTTNMQFMFDKATVRLTYKNPHPDQTISLGFKDQADWHYATKPFDIPFINSLNWQKNSSNPVLYQREQTYTSANSLLNNPPKNGIIGTFEYDYVAQNDLPSYRPLQQQTVINTALRGKHIMYVYLDHEPFHMQISKQDLNWYDGGDEVTVTVYKNTDQVYQITAEDDGIEDNSRNIMSPQEVTIKNPGKEFPESGVYKIIIDAKNDSIIKNIQTNLHKIVFQGSLFLSDNKEIYPSISATTSATIVYTDALSLSAITYHATGKQTIFVGKQLFNLDMVNMPKTIIPQEDFTKIIVPKNDVILNAFQGYFAFSPDQFFLPTKYHTMPITKREDIEMVDYILTNYHPAQRAGDWQINEQTFDLSTAYVKNNRLSWLIRAPKLKENEKEIMIKDIQVTFHKEGWL